MSQNQERWSRVCPKVLGGKSTVDLALQKEHQEILRKVDKHLCESKFLHIRIAKAMYSKAPHLVAASIEHTRKKHVVRGAILRRLYVIFYRPYMNLRDRAIEQAMSESLHHHFHEENEKHVPFHREEAPKNHEPNHNSKQR